MPKAYLSQLQAQLSLIKEKLNELDVPRSPLGEPLVKLPPKLAEQRRELLKRKQEVEWQIIRYTPGK